MKSLISKTTQIKNILLVLLFLLVLPIAIWYTAANFYVQQNNIFLPLKTDSAKNITLHQVSWQKYSNDNINIETIRNGFISTKDQPVLLKGLTKNNESIKVSFYGKPEIKKDNTMTIYVFSLGLGSETKKPYYAYPSKSEYEHSFSKAEHKVNLLKEKTWRNAYNFLFITLFSLWLTCGVAYYMRLKYAEEVKQEIEKDEDAKSKKNQALL